jgi:hypothetical protein
VVLVSATGLFGLDGGAEALLSSLLAAAVYRADLAPGGAVAPGLDDGFQFEGFGFFAQLAGSADGFQGVRCLGDGVEATAKLPEGPLSDHGVNSTLTLFNLAPADV